MRGPQLRISYSCDISPHLQGAHGHGCLPARLPGGRAHSHHGPACASPAWDVPGVRPARTAAWHRPSRAACSRLSLSTAVTTTSPASSFSPREPSSEVKAELQLLDSSWKPKPLGTRGVSGDRDRLGPGCPAADSQGWVYGAAVLTPERCISLDTRLGFPGGAPRPPSAPSDLQSRSLGKEPPAKLPRPTSPTAVSSTRRHGLGCFSRLPCHQSCPLHPNWLPPTIPEVSAAPAPTHISLSLVPSASRVQAP